MYTFSHKQGFVMLDPGIVVRIDKVLTELQDYYEQAKQESEHHKKQEMQK